MRLAEFIRDDIDAIMNDYESFSASHLSNANHLSPEKIRNSMKDVLLYIAEDMQSKQTSVQQDRKARGEKRPHSANTKAHLHGESRLENGLSILDINAEYRLLRSHILKKWVEDINKDDLSKNDFEDMIRFSEAIDETLNESVNRYNELLEEARNTFLAILGHDIRNPVGAISGMADLLIRSDSLKEKDRTLAKEIKFSSKHIADITDNLLELSRFQANGHITITKHTIDLIDIVRDTVQETRQAYPFADIKTEFEDPLLEVEADSMRMHQVVSNLLRNAIQHGDRKLPIYVTVKSHDGKAMISVHNHGKTIPESKFEKIFDKFKLPETDQETRNLGLGLYIVNQIMLAHDGDIAFTSTDDDGTTFTVTL